MRLPDLQRETCRALVYGAGGRCQRGRLGESGGALDAARTTASFSALGLCGAAVFQEQRKQPDSL